jgi:hypothetical protein
MVQKTWYIDSVCLRAGKKKKKGGTPPIEQPMFCRLKPFHALRYARRCTQAAKHAWCNKATENFFIFKRNYFVS